MPTIAPRLLVAAALAVPFASWGCGLQTPPAPAQMTSTGNLSLDLERQKIDRYDKLVQEKDPNYQSRLDRLDQLEKAIPTLAWRKGTPKDSVMAVFEADMGDIHIEISTNRPRPPRQAELYVLSATQMVEGRKVSWLLLPISAYAEKFFNQVKAMNPKEGLLDKEP